MSAVEERTAEKRPLNDKEDSNEVAVKEPRLENGKTEDDVVVIKQKAAKAKEIEAAVDGEDEDDDEDVDDEEVHDESSEGEGDGSEGKGDKSEAEGDDDEGDSGEEEDGDDAEGGEESD